MSSISLFRLAAGYLPPFHFVPERCWEEVGCFREELPVLGDWISLAGLHATKRPHPRVLANYHHRATIQSEIMQYGVCRRCETSVPTKIYTVMNCCVRTWKQANRIGFLVMWEASFELLHRQLWPMERVLQKLRSNFCTQVARMFPREKR